MPGEKGRLLPPQLLRQTRATFAFMVQTRTSYLRNKVKTEGSNPYRSLAAPLLAAFDVLVHSDSPSPVLRP